MIEPYKGPGEFGQNYLRWLEIFRNDFNTIPQQLTGSGTPEGVIFAAASSRYYDTAGPTRLYVKTTGSNVNTGWEAYDTSGSVVQLAAALTADTAVGDNDTICEIAAVPAAYYRVHCYIKFTVTANGTFGIRIAGAATVSSTSLLRYFTEAVTAPATPFRAHQGFDAGGFATLTTANEWICEINGMLQVDTAGTIHVKFDEGTGTLGTAREASILTLHRP